MPVSVQALCSNWLGLGHTEENTWPGTVQPLCFDVNQSQGWFCDGLE